MALAARAAGEKTYVMKISLATVGDALHQFAKDYAAAVEKDFGGRIKAEIYPASQLGSIQQQAEGVQFGAIQVPDRSAGIPRRHRRTLRSSDRARPGHVDTRMASALPPTRRCASLMLGLGADKGLHGVALFMVGAVRRSFATKPIRHLADFKGKKIRIFASQFQRVAMQRLGAVPKPMTLGEVLPALQDNALDGAVSASTVSELDAICSVRQNT